MTDLREQLAEILWDNLHDGENGRSLDQAADAILAALLGRVPPWQPIETAPKDSKVVLWSKRFGPKIAAWGGYAGYNQPEFTHWMPLPADPFGVQGGEA